MHLMAVIYARLSLAKDGSTLAVERQEGECRELAARLGLPVEHVYVDNDISATTGAVRPAFEAMLKAKPEAIIVWHMDRLLRRMRDLETVIKLGVPVHSVTAGDIDLSTASGQLVGRMLTAVASYEGDHKAERQRASHRQRVALGAAWWSSRPFGFEMDRTIRPQEAEALREAYRAILSGSSLRSVARTLNEAGLLTNKGNGWRAETLGPVLLSPRNAGLIASGGEVMGKADWPAIVGEETWRAVCSILKDPSRRKGAGRAPAYLLTGFATCGKCRSAVKAASRKGYTVYTCRAHSCVSIRTRLADDYTLNRIIFGIAEGRLSHPIGEGGPDGAHLAEEAATIRQRLNDLATDYAEGLLTRPQLQAGTARAQARLAEVEQAMADAYTPDYGDLEWMSYEIDEMGIEQQRALVRTLVASVVLHSPGRGQKPTKDHVEVTLAG